VAFIPDLCPDTLPLAVVAEEERIGISASPLRSQRWDLWKWPAQHGWTTS